jgi:hypothetical protein
LICWVVVRRVRRAAEPFDLEGETSGATRRILPGSNEIFDWPVKRRAEIASISRRADPGAVHVQITDDGASHLAGGRSQVRSPSRGGDIAGSSN